MKNGRFLILDEKGFGYVGDFCYNCTSYSNLNTRLYVPSHGREQREQREFPEILGIILLNSLMV